MSTPRYLDLPDQVQPAALQSRRGSFAALEAQPGIGVCERRPALLVPGFTGSKEDFIPVLQPLAAAGRRVFAIDMRGQYQSQGPSDSHSYAPAELAADITAITDVIAPDGLGVHLLGHSLGGLIARETALAGQAQIVSLTLLSSGPASVTGERADTLRSMLATLDAETGNTPGQLPAYIGSFWDQHLAPQARAEGTPESIIDFLRTRMLSNSPTGLVTMGRYLLACPDRTAELASLDWPPILVLYGENDDAWCSDIQETMARELRAQRVCIPGVGHSPAVEAPETTASTLTGFWGRAEESKRRRDANRKTHGGQSARAGAPAAAPASATPASATPA